MQVSYDMNRLQRLDRAARTTSSRSTAPTASTRDRVLAAMVYEHPIYTPESVAAQRRLPELNDGRLAFAGAYHGWGFHEDGCAAGRARAAPRRPGDGLVTAVERRSPRATPALYDVAVRHARHAAAQRASRYRGYLWLVDLDDAAPARRAGCGRSAALRGAPTTSATRPRTIRDNVDRYLAGHGIDLRGGRVLMLANARVARATCSTR